MPRLYVCHGRTITKTHHAMKITNLAIKYRTVVVVLTLLLTVGGIFSYVTIPKESNPSIEVSTVVVTAIYPGASPDDVEATVTQIIEQEISTISGIDELRSTSTEGVASIIVEFTPDIDPDNAYQEVNDAVDLAEPDLPEAVEDPLVSEINFDEFPIMTVNLAADYSLARLKEVAEDLQDEVEGIPSVLEANLVGGLEREVQVNVDLNALKTYDLAFSDIISTIQQENTNIPGGAIDVDEQSFLVRVDGQFEDPAREIEDLVLNTSEGRNVYVRDVADVVFGFKDQASYARLQILKEENEEGEPVALPEEESRMLQVISLNVTKVPGENIVETSEAVQETIEGFNFPRGTQVLVTGDQSEFVATMLTDLENNIISGLIFVVLVLLFFLGVRNATLVGIAIPLSMFISFIIFQAAGYTLNFIILFSFIIALGMLVDNAVVIVENIYRFRENGHSRFEAARLGTAEVGGPVAASTATTVAAFAPMLFWPGIIGEFMSYLPLTLIITLTASLFVALIINPVVTGFFVKVKGEEDEERSWPKAARYAGAAAILLLGIVLGIANWKTLVVIVVGVPLVYLLYAKVLRPIADRFMEEGLPAFVKRYRGFLGRMLERDYAPRRAMLRNTGALAALVGGVILLILGGLVAAAAGQTAALILFVPGGLLLALGLLGVVVHSIELLYLGGRTTVKAGLIFGAVMAVLLAYIYVSPRALTLLTMAKLMLAPLFIVAVGAVGALMNRRERLLLTDNRAALLNGSLGGFVLIVVLFMIAPTGQGFFPEMDPFQVQVNLEAPQGTTVEASNRIAREAQDRIDQLLAENPASEANVENILVNVGVGGDAFFGGGAQAAERSRIAFNMVDYAEREESSPETLEKLRSQLQGIPGVDLDITGQQGGGPPTGPPVNIEISGPDFDRIVEITREIKDRMTEAAETGRLPGLVDVTDNLNTGRPEVQVDIDRTRAAQFGLSTVGIAQTVRAAIQGIEADTYRSGEDEYDITVRLQEADRQSLASLQRLTISNDDGVQIPLVAVADIERGTGFGSITRIDQERVVTVEGDAAPGYNGPEVLGRVQTLLADYRQALPPGYSLEYTGGNEEQQESFGFLFTALLMGVALIFMIMVFEFNSVAAPFIIIVAVGLSIIGVLLGLLLTRTPFNLFTFIGIIGLAGIVVNNNIVLIDYIMQLRQRGLGKLEAIIEGGATRLRPVLLTALTTVIGLVPLTFGINIDFVGILTDLDPNFQFGSENTQFWGPMGTAIISGLTFGTFLTLVIVPVMYSAFDSLSLRLTGAFGGNPEEAGLVSETTTSDGAAPASNGAARGPGDARGDASRVPAPATHP